MKEIVCLTELGYAFVSTCRSPEGFGKASAATNVPPVDATALTHEGTVVSDDGLRLAKGLVIDGGNPLSATINGDLATIDVRPFTAYFEGRANPVHFSSGSISLLARGTVYYVFAVDPRRAGGAVAFQAATKMEAASVGDRIFIGTIRIPA